MDDPALPPAGAPRLVKPMRASSVVGRTFRVWFATLPQLLTITAIVCVPLIAANWFLQARKGWAENVAAAIPVIQLVAVSAIAQAFAVYVVFQRLRGERTDLRRSIQIGGKRLGSVMGIALLLSAPQLALVVAMILLNQQTIDQALDPVSRNPDVRQLGSILAIELVVIVFELVVTLVFPVAAPAAVVENRGVFAALGRSAALTKGSRSTIFSIGIILGMVYLIPVGVPMFLITMMRASTAQFLLRSGMDLLFSSLTCVLPIVLYHELRESKEGIGIAELAAVFD